MSQSIKINPLGFREYDARWIYEERYQFRGNHKILEKVLVLKLKNIYKKENPRVIVGHDYRSYSEKIKIALKRVWCQQDVLLKI